jgi:hypothetical protein
MDLDKDAEYITDHLMRIVFPERDADDAFRELLRRNAWDNLDIMWRIVAGRDEIEAKPPFGALAFSDMAAELNVSLSEFERIYRVGAGLVMSLWHLHALEYAAAHDVPLENLLGAPAMIVHAYIDGQISAMLCRFEAAQAEHLRTRERLQVSVLRQALDGSAALSEPEIEEALHIRLRGQHVGVAVHTERDPSESGLLRHLERAAGGARGLPYRHGVRLWLIWLSQAQALPPEALTELRAALERSGFRAAIGEPAGGLSGLGATGRDAVEAARLQDRLGDHAEPVVSFDDLRLEVLILNDPVRARRFVRDELRGLGADDIRTEVLRDTARQWLTTGSNVVTAQRMNVHEHTVRNRLTQIETLVGRPIVNRRTELLVALRLNRLLEQATETPG